MPNVPHWSGDPVKTFGKAVRKAKKLQRQGFDVKVEDTHALDR
jgi:hypothetical protein